MACCLQTEEDGKFIVMEINKQIEEDPNGKCKASSIEEAKKN